MQVVPLQPTANQTLQCQLNGQSCTIDVWQTAYGLFFTLYVGTQLIKASVICENLVALIREAYFGFSGDFAFVDTQGTSDPVFTGFGTRFILIYFTPADLTAQGFSE
jgi:hypothetical protein